MHETSLVAELVAECERRAGGRRVAAVRVRRANSIEEGALRELFAAIAGGGPLAGAELDAEVFDIRFRCSRCGFDGELATEYVYGHLRVCPGCGAVSDADGSAELELLDVVLAT